MQKEIQAILRSAGQIMLSAQNIENAVEEKEGNANFVTKYDVAVQQLLRRELLALRPQAQFVGEEGDAQGDALSGDAFIVDPIDGTTNFIKHFGTSAISVALAQNGRVTLGACYDPYRDEFFYAELGKGAFCNGQPIHVTSLPLSECLVSFGTSPYYADLRARTFRLAQDILDHALDLRRSGAAVLDLCNLARGCSGLMFEFKLSPWDYAAASLIVTEAGGKISQMDGSPITLDRPCSVAAGAPQAYDEFFRLGLNQY